MSEQELGKQFDDVWGTFTQIGARIAQLKRMISERPGHDSTEWESEIVILEKHRDVEELTMCELGAKYYSFRAETLRAQMAATPTPSIESAPAEPIKKERKPRK